MDSVSDNDTARPRHETGRATPYTRPIAAADLALRFAAFWVLTILTSSVVAIPYLTVN
jgi:hypothetical protein